MNFVFKIEELFNKLFWLIIQLTSKLIPSSVVAKYKQIKKWFKFKKKKLQISFSKFVRSLLVSLKRWNESFFNKADLFKDYPFKEKVSEFKLNLLIYLKSNSKKQIVKDFFSRFTAIFSTLFMKPAFVKSFVFLLIFSAGYFGYQMIELSNSPSRAIASTVSKIKRPEYKKYKRRTLKVMNVSIPVIIKSKKDIHSLLTDFYVRTDTVFAKLYLDHNQHKIRDRFYENTYRMPASFPLDNDGKRVIKEKIAYELNQLLKENKVEGKVLEVLLDAPIAN